MYLAILVSIIGMVVAFFAFQQSALAPIASLTPSPVAATIATPTPKPTPPKQTPVKPSTTPLPWPKNNTVSVPLGKQFTLTKGQVVTLGDTGLTISITDFYNNPCPKDVNCFWSGVGIGFEYRLNGKIEKGLNLTRAFGYHTTIVKTDHETYANLIVAK